MVELYHRPSVQFFFLSSAIGRIANQNSENKNEKNKKIASVVRDCNSLPLLLLQLIVTFVFAILRMADLPDLSHLTAEERRIIESVMMRQKQEEEREHEIMR
ncbi:hypothetical protein L9F63_017610 [Diploptera punctata]|uniref:RabBD domain-containing protein n=1 Tax=Diploptera punctata TaxID=6984 RepID=A0AAD8EGD6_DIPPU|nr:hypothetical protein L9F63_017610 [Diploptera punctata]